MKERNKFIRSIITIIILILAIIVLLILYIQTSSNSRKLTLENRALEFCDQTNVESVSICNNQVIEVKTSLSSDGTIYHHRDGTTFSCKVVTTTPDCKAIFNAQQTGQWNCREIC